MRFTQQVLLTLPSHLQDPASGRRAMKFNRPSMKVSVSAVVAVAAIILLLFMTHPLLKEQLHAAYSRLAWMRLNSAITEEYKPGLSVDVYLPDSKLFPPPWPTVLVFHGGSWSGGSRTGDDARWVARLLRSHGYAVVSADYRLTSDGHRYPSQLRDISDVRRWTLANADRFSFDRYRLGAAGFSAGGHLAATLAMKYAPENPDQNSPGRVRALFSTGGIYNLARLHESIEKMKERMKKSGATASEWPDLKGRVEALLGECPQSNAMLATLASPQAFAVGLPPDRMPPPSLIMAGRKDRTVPVEQARSFVESLRQVGSSVVYHETDSDHFFNVFVAAGEPNFGEREIIRFFDAYLKNRPSPLLKSSKNELDL